MISYLGNRNLFETSSKTDSNHLVASLRRYVQEIGQMISIPSTLRYYDFNEEVTIETVVGDYKLRAVLIQGIGLVAFARHSITDEGDTSRLKGIF